MSTLDPPATAYPDWPNVAPEEFPAAYKKAWLMRPSLAQEIERYIERGWASSQSDFAVRSGIGHAVLRRWLAGTSWPSTETLASAEGCWSCRCGRTKTLANPTCAPKAATTTPNSVFDVPGATVKAW